MRAPLSAFLFALALPMAAPAQAKSTDTAGPAQRIWASMMLEQQECWFRRTVELPKAATRLRLWFTCDNECTVFVDGVEVGSNDDWTKLGNAQLDGEWKGKVTIAVHAKNTGGPGALSLWLLWDDVDGAHEMATDTDWRVTAVAETGWNTPGHDDAKWEQATANFDTTFGKNLYNGEPTGVRVFNALTKLADPIATALEQLRQAPDRAAALKALEAIDRAVVEARGKLWQKRAADQR
ncbi:MAG: hypothetical protein JNK15_04100 [Planctomycetes bacterium]|nr:hypothetical protein [Planctomycetota bacterium]